MVQLPQTQNNGEYGPLASVIATALEYIATGPPDLTYCMQSIIRPTRRSPGRTRLSQGPQHRWLVGHRARKNTRQTHPNLNTLNSSNKKHLYHILHAKEASLAACEHPAACLPGFGTPCKTATKSSHPKSPQSPLPYRTGSAAEC